jgi:fatty acyl-CoA reductase
MRAKQFLSIWLYLLQAFLHISTAYCQDTEKVLYEKLYPPPADPHKIIKCAEWLGDDVLNAMTKK